MPYPFLIHDLISINLIPLAYALVLGGLVGLEREWSGRAAGLRTHVIVCVSSTMLIMLSQNVGANVNLVEDGRLVFDPNRMAAGIVTGIGFLGAATVLRSGDTLRGLTTAACIWYVAGLGIVLGNENYILAVVGTIVVLLTLTVLNLFTHLFRSVVYRRLIVIHTVADVQELTDQVTQALAGKGCRVLDIASGHDNLQQRNELVFYICLKNGLQAPRATEEIASLTGVCSARWKLISNQP
ncbi:MAG: putative Mg2+ transporter-C (MgtC) family protein [Planctomycetota bacterium]|jgi:putative Mg2+ transporter-C (MgtC) family protein